MKNLIKNKIIQTPLTNDIFKKKGIVTFINPFAYTYIRKNTKILNSFDYIYIDGFLLVKFINTFYKAKIERVSFDMTGLAPKLFDYSEKNNCSIYLIGDTEEAITNAIKNIKNKYPQINIIGYRNGFFSSIKEKEKCYNKIISLNPDYVIVGMGLLLQEEFLVKLKEKGWNGLGFTCGGFFHQIRKENLSYYPKLINKLNLRWVYRFIKEPNVRWRLLKIIFIFPFQFIYDKFK